MDRNLHDDYFERFLRESVEEFRMIPSRRVWTSLYNNLHPGKKWPSLAVCIFLISSVVYIGLSHSSANGTLTASTTTNNNNLIAGTPLYKTGSPHRQATGTAGSDENIDGQSAGRPDQVESSAGNGSVQISSYHSNNTGSSSVTVSGITNRTNQTNARRFAQQGQRQDHNSAILAALKHQRTQDNKQPATSWSASSAKTDETETGINVSDLSTIITTGNGHNAGKESSSASSLQATSQPGEREWIDNHAFYNKPKQGFKNRLTYQIYATPSIGFRNMNSNLDDASVPANLSIGNSSLVAEKDHSIVHTPAINMEAGYSLIYSLSKTFRIKGGMQLNYSNYYVHAQQLDHPMGASLLINGNDGLEMINKPSTIANNQSEEHARKYSNNSFQLSLPIGADIRLAGNNRFQWFAGATIQPTYVLSGNAFLLSSDMKNYVFDANFVRKWNLNAGFETFVSYKVNQAVMINAGPQFRYQFRSSYIDKYTYDVRMYNLGIKLGIVQQF